MSKKALLFGECEIFGAIRNEFLFIIVEYGPSATDKGLPKLWNKNKLFRKDDCKSISFAKKILTLNNFD